jgi:hypothetical protein
VFLVSSLVLLGGASRIGLVVLDGHRGATWAVGGLLYASFGMLGVYGWQIVAETFFTGIAVLGDSFVFFSFFFTMADVSDAEINQGTSMGVLIS